MDPRQVELGQVVAITRGLRKGYVGKIVGTVMSNTLVRLSGLRGLFPSYWLRQISPLEQLAMEAV